MQNYLPNFIEGSLDVIISGVLVVCFFIPKYPKLYKKKWLILCAICLFALGGNEVYKGFVTYSNKRIPTKSDIQWSLSQTGKTALNDFIYSSTDGYSVLMPAGFTYSEPGGGISVAALKSLDQEANVAFFVMKFNDTKDLDQIIADIQQLKPNGKTYYFDKGEQGKNLRKGIVEVHKEGVFAKGAIALIKRGSSVYQIMLSTKESHFEQIGSIFERILKSFVAVQ